VVRPSRLHVQAGRPHPKFANPLRRRIAVGDLGAFERAGVPAAKGKSAQQLSNSQLDLSLTEFQHECNVIRELPPNCPQVM
jgi:hypothetical protein